LQSGKEPHEARCPEKFNVTGVDIILPANADWKRELEAAISRKGRMEAIPA